MALYHLVQAIKPASLESYTEEVNTYEGYAEHLKSVVCEMCEFTLNLRDCTETGSSRMFLKATLVQKIKIAFIPTVLLDSRL